MADHDDFSDITQPGDEPDPRIIDERPLASFEERAFPSSELPAYVDTAADASASHQFIDFVKALHRRRWSAITVFIIVFGFTIVRTFTMVPVYEATTRLLIESDNPNVISFKEVISEDQSQAGYYQTQYNILESRSLARRTLRQLDMLPKSAAATKAVAEARMDDGFPGWVERMTGVNLENYSWLRTTFHLQNKSRQRMPDETAAEAQAIDSVLSHLKVVPVRNSRLVDLQYRSTDPDAAARILNAHARQYIEQNLEFKFLSSKEASDWLANQLAQQREQVEQAESALQQYREREDSVSLDERQNIVVQKLADLNSAVTHAKTERIEKEAFYNQVRALQNNPNAIDTIPAILANGYIQQLKADISALQRQQADLAEQLGDRHPDIVKIKGQIQVAQARLQLEIGKVVESFRHEYETAVDRERSLVGALDAQKDEALALNRKGIEYGVLQRDAESSRQVYDSLLQRVKQTEVSTELKTSNIRIVDPAERPLKPVLPEPEQDLLMGVLAGLVLAIGVAFTFEFLDNRIKSPDEIRVRLGLPWLGLIPAVSKKDIRKAGGAALLNNAVPGGFAEAFRTVRTNVVFSSAQPGARTIVVTSAGPSEGKTLVSSNLAIALATAGQRVLLIDADLRRPKMHELFKIDQEPGLSHLLVGDAKAQEAVRSTEIKRLRVLPAGRIPPNPAELLSSQRFVKFLRAMGEHFSWIIIDSPPVMAVTDACVIAHETSGVLFVAAAEMTHRRSAQEALDKLRSAHAHLIGGVLNRVDLDRNGYYYSQHYRREYTKYYGQQTA